MRGLQLVVVDFLLNRPRGATQSEMLPHLPEYGYEKSDYSSLNYPLKRLRESGIVVPGEEDMTSLTQRNNRLSKEIPAFKKISQEYLKTFDKQRRIRFLQSSYAESVFGDERLNTKLFDEIQLHLSVRFTPFEVEALSQIAKMSPSVLSFCLFEDNLHSQKLNKDEDNDLVLDLAKEDVMMRIMIAYSYDLVMLNIKADERYFYISSEGGIDMLTRDNTKKRGIGDEAWSAHYFTMTRFGKENVAYNYISSEMGPYDRSKQEKYATGWASDCTSCPSNKECSEKGEVKQCHACNLMCCSEHSGINTIDEKNGIILCNRCYAYNKDFTTQESTR